MEFSKWKNFFVVLIMIMVLAASASFFIQDIKPSFASQAAVSDNSTVNQVVYTPPQKLANPPEIIKAVYVTSYSAGTKSYLNYLSNLFKNTEINAVVVDIKGSDGYVSYASGASDVKKYNLDNDVIRDIDSLIRFLHDKNIYVIARIAVFEDPQYSKARPNLAVYDKLKTIDIKNPVLWEDNNKLSWLDPASKDVWDYDVSLAKDAFYHGVDEVNFDYVRFPSDGKTGNMGFPIWDGKVSMSDVIKNFFQYVRGNLPNEKISVDLFGQTTVNTDDMGIGQLIENAFLSFDYVCPMVYPSHYINGFIGFQNPAEHPYDVIKYSLDSAVNRENVFLAQQQKLTATTSTAQQPVIFGAKIRPWLQDFNIGAVYNTDMVEQEIKATQDSLGNNFKGFMLWNPSNIYTWGAVLKSN